jgi:hypothetical protein
MPNRINRETLERGHYDLMRAVQKFSGPKTGATDDNAGANGRAVATLGSVATTFGELKVGERTAFPTGLLSTAR